jgi:hypothetical protein
MSDAEELILCMANFVGGIKKALSDGKLTKRDAWVSFPSPHLFNQPFIHA